MNSMIPYPKAESGGASCLQDGRHFTTFRKTGDLLPSSVPNGDANNLGALFTARSTRSLVRVTRRHVELLTRNGSTYAIPIRRVNTGPKLLGWILHLTVKPWVTPAHVAALIEAAETLGIKELTMAVSKTTLAIQYVGNGSSSIEYEISFPFLDTAHIYAAVSANGIAPPALLSPSAYTVTRLPDGSGGALKTKIPVVGPGTITIFRSTPLVQPTRFQLQGPFPATAAETGLDRLLMQVQELQRQIDQLRGTESDLFIKIPSNPEATHDVAVWEDFSWRSNMAPKWIGQLGVEKMTHTVWIGVSLAVGGWEEFRPRRKNSLTLGLVADAGDPVFLQSKIADVLGTWGPDAVLFAGDNNYNGANGYSVDWGIFNTYTGTGKAFPALGNHDLDSEGYEDLHNNTFSYIPPNSNGHRRYYTVVLGGGLVQLFVLNSGKNSLGDIIEIDGIHASSKQAQWLDAELAKSTARWKIAMFHHPFVTTSGEADRVINEMRWPALEQMDLICCGHTHMLELLQEQKYPLIANISAAIHNNGVAESVLQGAVSPQSAHPLWVDDTNYGIARINANEERLNIEIWDHDRNVFLHGRDVRDFNGPAKYRETWRVTTSPAVPTPDVDIYLGTLCDSAVVQEVVVTAAAVGTIDMEFQVHAGLIPIASGTLEIGQSMASVAIATPPMIPKGTKLTFTHNTYPGPGTDAKGVDVSLVGVRYN